MPPNQIHNQLGFVSRDYVLYLREFAVSKGVTAKILLHNTQTDMQFLLNPPKQVSEVSFHQMGFNLFNALENPFVGVIEFGKGMLLSMHGPLGVAIQGADNLDEVANLANKYYQTRANSRSLQVIESATHICLRLSDELLEHDYYYLLSTLISFEHIVAKLLSHHQLKLCCIIEQQASEPENFPWQLIQGFEINFNQAHNQILVPLEWMKLPINPIDPEMAILAKNQCEQTMEELSSQGLLEQISFQLQISKDKNISLKNMAQMLHVSPSTLQRRLRQFNTTFKQVKLDRRLVEAKRLLTEHQFTLEHISEQLGFCDASSFTKSFKTTTGVTPSAFRLQHHGVINDHLFDLQ